MRVEVANEITIYEPTEEIRKWCYKNLTFVNSDYLKKSRMGFYVGNTPKEIRLYRETHNSIIVPYGVLSSLYHRLDCEVVSKFKQAETVEYGAKIPLRDYQEIAKNEMIKARGGILQSKAGSGKTQIGIALATELKKRTLWITHTHDLLNQSKKRAVQYIDTSLIGTITEGKVNIGKGITFATVQTLAGLNLPLYRDYWDVIIVDECHRVAGNVSQVTQFQYVLDNLSARYKYGLSATVHRADGLIGTTYCILGKLQYTVPDEAVNDYVMDVAINPIDTGIKLSYECLNTDGTMNYTKLITYLCNNKERNEIITKDLVFGRFNSNLILSDRTSHLKELIKLLPPTIRQQTAYIDGSMTSKNSKEKREQAIEDMRSGKKKYLFATYRLAKEGLDIPCLDRLYLTTPQKDYAVITQSIGRIARVSEGKGQPICFDYVDDIQFLIKSYKKRVTTYKKCKCQFLK